MAATSTAQDLINLKGIVRDLDIDDKKILQMNNQRVISMINSYENSKQGNT